MLRVACLAGLLPISVSASALERILFVRHGEKPPTGLGQLDCQGLNRALALPSYFAHAFGTPDAIFAPDPGRAKKDAGELYDYVRPLITIGPTAIAFGLPVQAHIGFDDLKRLEDALEAPRLKNALVLVAWEHKIIDQVARDILSKFGADPGQVPAWADEDFDSVEVIEIDSARATFSRTQEGLNGQPKKCPG